ncbi:MAG: PEP-CTERM sorting domain-containing protein [Planctomycetia bacterium]|nr:PEP-CTERM sorting domain-containing protein [Planctomycetia bacterium]
MRRLVALLCAAAWLAMHGGVEAATITWRGTTDGAWNTATANWAGGSTTFTAGDTVTFDDTATGTTGITTAAAVSPAGTVTFNNATKNYSLSGAGGLSGTLNLTKLGAGSLTLSNSNAFSGTLTLRGGTTTFSGNAIVTATTGAGVTSGTSFQVGTTAGDSATLLIKDNATFSTNNMFLANAAGATGTVLMQGGTFSIAANATSNSFFRIGSSGTGIWNQSGGLANIGTPLATIGRNAGAVGQATVSSGTFRLTGTTSNDYLQLAGTGTGTLTVSGNGVVETGTGSGGGLWFNVVGGVAQTSGAGTLNLDGGTLRTRRVLSSGSVAATSTFNFNGGTLLALTSTSAFMQGLTAANVKAGGAVIDTNGNDVTIAQSLLDSGSGSLRKIGAGTLTLSGSSTYRGGTIVDSGTLGLGHSSGLGWSGGGLTVNPGGTLDLNGFSASSGRLALSNAVLVGFDENSARNKLSVASAVISGTNYLEVAATTSGTYDLISSTGGGLAGTFMFRGSQDLDVPATRMVAKSGGGYLDLQLTNSATAETLVVRAADTAGLVSIMSLGASITAGYSSTGTAKDGQVITSYNGGGYRSQLYQNLVNDGRFVPNFIGSSTASLAVSANGSNILQYAGQTRHEGHSGYTTSQILWNLNHDDGNASNSGGFWLSGTNPNTSGGNSPDYIPINVGGNDFGQTQFRNSGAIERYDATLSEVRSLRPNAAVIATTLMYRSDVSTYVNTYFNPYLEDVVYSHVLAGEDVRFLDLYGLITPGGNGTNVLSSDGIHPTQSGYNAMADAFARSITHGAAYWSGDVNGNWSAVVGGTNTNWTSDRAGRFDRQATLDSAAATQITDPYGTVNQLLPDVFFGSSGTVATTLDANTSIRGLNFTSGASGAVSVGGTATLTIGAGGITVQRGSGGHTVAANVSLAADQTWGDVAASDFTVSGALSGSGALTVVGSYTTRSLTTLTSGTTYAAEVANTQAVTTVGDGGAIVLTGNNQAYGGTVTVSRYGTLRLGHRNALGSGSLVLDGGTLDIAASNPLVGSLTGTAGTITSSVAGAVVLTASTALSGTYAGTFADGAGTVGLTKTGASTLTLAGTAANTHTGLTTITGGTLVLAKTAGVQAIGGNIQLGDGSGADVLRLAASNQISDTSVITLSGTAANQRGWLQLYGQTETIGGLASAGVGHGLVANEAATGSDSVLTLNVSGTYEFSGLMRNGASAGGSLSLVKAGLGLQTLSGSNTFTGSTAVQAGILEVAAGGRLAATSGVTVSAGGELRVRGAINAAAPVTMGGLLSGTGTLGPVVLSGTLAPGVGIGTLTTGTLTWNGGAVALFDLATGTTSADLVSILGDLRKGSGGAYRFDFQGGGAWNGSQPSIYTLLTWSGTTDFSALDFTSTNLAAGLQGQFQVSGNSLSVVVVPEPATLALVAAGGLVAGGMRRRKKWFRRSTSPMKTGLTASSTISQNFRRPNTCIQPARVGTFFR